MSTLEQLAVSLGFGASVLAGTLLLFGGALALRITHIAPRCEARPRNVIYNPDTNCDECQRKGNPFLLGWLFWSLRLSYKTMIEGIPGTGTRNDGLSGHLLTVNLDGILLLRFHALGLRIASFASFIYCVIALPLYVTSRCFHNPFQNTTELSLNCTDEDTYNLTSYDRLTLTNVPPVNEATAFEASQVGVYVRLYIIVLCSYVVCWFTCYELHKEWIDLLAMRRVYYLEYDHWQGRREELKATMADVDQSKHHNSQNPHLHEREVWIPHPEQRDTPPNIGLYSVLVGNLPKRPRHWVSEEDLEASMSEKVALDWQLAVTSAFFDYCVPNQPGFSSSVAAVTILPSADDLATAWKKWYGATKKLQRLRFIRRQLRKRGYQGESSNMNLHETNGSVEGGAQSPPPTASSDSQDNYDNDDDFDIYLQTSTRRDDYIREILGCITDEKVERMFLDTLQMGPEQTAVYSVELAKGSSRCCPHGFCEERILCSSIDQLVQLQAEAVQQAHDAFLELEVTRKEAAEAVFETAEEAKCTFLFQDDKGRELGAASSHRSGDMESRLFGIGQAALEMASNKQKREKQEFQTQYSRGEPLRQQQSSQGEQSHPSEGEIKGESQSPSRPDHTLSGSESRGPNGGTYKGEGLPAREKPLMNLEGACHFPSLLQIPIITDGDGNGSNNVTSFRASEEDSWDLVKRVAAESETGADRTGDIMFRHQVSDGVWNRPSLKLWWKDFKEQASSMIGWTATTSDLATDLLARDSQFAVVTFTSRQAAIAARRCLADGRGAGRWKTFDDLPMFPLADASAFNICDCRGCMRPVTISLNDHQKIWRGYCAKVSLAIIYVFYTFPITWAATFGSEKASGLLPNQQYSATELYGLIRGQLLNLFLALCPHMFLAIANFGSGATSMVQAEFSALQYYWWFFLLFALLGSSIAQMVERSFLEGSFQFAETLQRVAATIPSQVSSIWANWTILKATVFHPLFYLLQLHSFLFAAFGLKCCLRLVRGGGAGNRVPYRWYVESGMVLMFVLALAPAAPIVAPIAVMYFLICNPLLRHILIFTYKPQFDAGAIRFPFLFDMCISSMIVSQVLLCMMMVLKGAVGPAVIAGLLCVPTLVFRRTCRRRFLSAYKDAALLQTSLLDGWEAPDDSMSRTTQGREEFRRFLVDCHKASYVPVCVAGTNTDKILTAEPAMVIPAPTDIDNRTFSRTDLQYYNTMETSSPTSTARSQRIETFQKGHRQAGALLRRNLAGSTAGAAAIDIAVSATSPDKSQRSESAGSQTVKLSSLGLIEVDDDGETHITEKKEKKIS
ncbi:expressed unknown protein [Seminavis robusta]|uniref:CSC1/OSCA1-like 7TM region domain-containing protein n=1 Tax=Seminavis robusta TaxID=568900 RepID=A0A9N8DC37_9STRA|nr:expressed unknown protein [Seminavis robusta]|eukprot:Sro12_g009430.1 n/a (1302) ;mRNA; f:121526-126352